MRFYLILISMIFITSNVSAKIPDDLLNSAFSRPLTDKELDMFMPIITIMAKQKNPPSSSGYIVRNGVEYLGRTLRFSYRVDAAGYEKPIDLHQIALSLAGEICMSQDFKNLMEYNNMSLVVAFYDLSGNMLSEYEALPKLCREGDVVSSSVGEPTDSYLLALAKYNRKIANVMNSSGDIGDELFKKIVVKADGRKLMVSYQLTEYGSSLGVGLAKGIENELLVCDGTPYRILIDKGLEVYFTFVNSAKKAVFSFQVKRQLC